MQTSVFFSAMMDEGAFAPDSGEVAAVTDQEKRTQLEREFLGEALRVLADAGVDLLELEVGGDGVEHAVLGRLSRITQTMRGGAGLLGLNAMHELALVLEAVLDLARHEKLPLDTVVVTAIERGMDAFAARFKGMRDSQEAGGTVGRTEVKQAVQLLQSVVRQPADARCIAERHVVRGPDVDAAFTMGGHDLRRASREGLRFYVLAFDVEHDLRQKDVSPLGLLVFLQKSGDVVDARFTGLRGGGGGNVGVLFSSILDADLLGAVFQIDASRVFTVDTDAVARGDAAWREREQPAPDATRSVMPDEPDSQSIELLLLQYDEAMKRLREQSMQDDFEPYDMNGDTDAKPASQNAGGEFDEVSGVSHAAPEGQETVSPSDIFSGDAADHPLQAGEAVSEVSVEDASVVDTAVESMPQVDAPGSYGFFDDAPGTAPMTDDLHSVAGDVESRRASGGMTEDDVAGDDAAESLLLDLEAEFDAPLLDEADAYAGETRHSGQTHGLSFDEETPDLADGLSIADSDLDFFRDDAPPPDQSHLDLPFSERGENLGGDGIVLDLGFEDVAGNETADVEVVGEAAVVSTAAPMSPGSPPVEPSVTAVHVSVGDASAPQTPSVSGIVSTTGSGESVGMSSPASPVARPSSCVGVAVEATSGGFDVREAEGSGILVLSGELTIERSLALRDALLEMFDRYQNVRLDLSGVTEVDLTFFQLLRAAVVTAQRRGGTLAGCGVIPAPVSETAYRAGLDAQAVKRAGFDAVLGGMA